MPANPQTLFLPCPFCGTAAIYRCNQGESLWSHDIVDWHEVYCGECDIRMLRCVDLDVLYRDRNLGLWGIPYKMRPGQSPRDLKDAHDNYRWPAPGHYGPKRISLDDWVYLGHPGWYGSMTPAKQEAVKAFLAQHRDSIPGYPHEWSELEPGSAPLLLDQIC
jgi:hypothetical protein